jgi:Ca-activated chloride channel homolog
MNFLFEHPEFIWLFPGILMLVLLFAWMLRWKKTVIRRMGDEHLVKQLIRDYSPRRFNAKFILLSFGFALGVVAAMNPRTPGAPDERQRKGIDIAIALDVSKSMLATDLQPSRMERAKQFINKLITSMPDNRIALVLFAGKSYLQMPLTVDHGAAKMYVSSASPDAVPQQGTLISDALKMSAGVFNNADNRFKAVVLISDGETHEEAAVETAKDLSKLGVMINAIGIGSEEGATIFDPATGMAKKDETGKTVISKLNEETLRQIASNSHGVYVRLQGSDEGVALVEQQLSQIEKTTFDDISMMNYKNWYMWFAATMFLVLFIENFISERKKVAL